MKITSLLSVIVVLALMGLLIWFVAPNWRHTGKSTNANAIAWMDACIDTEKKLVKGQSAIDGVYRLCWMRTKTDLSK